MERGRERREGGREEGHTVHRATEVSNLPIDLVLK